MKNTTYSLSAFAGLLAHLGQATDVESFGLIAARSGSPVHLQSLNANGGFFWVGKPTSTYCPPSIPGCPNGAATNDTVFTYDFNPATSRQSLSLDVVVPGGQQVYVDPTSGALTRSPPHSAGDPNGLRTPFTFSGESSAVSVHGSLTIPGCGAIACPEHNAYRIYSNDEYKGTQKDKCLGVDLLSVAFKGQAAWEYE